MIFRQLFDPASSTYTYVLGDETTRQAVIIDPVIECIDRDIAAVEQLGLELEWVLDTHVHADHVTGARALALRTGAKTAVGAGCGATGYDAALCDGATITLGADVVRAVATPGHTEGSTSFVWRDRVFTGDALLIGGCGRTDFQCGDARTLYASITRKLFTLDDDTLVYPGHDYKGRRVSTIGEEKATNPRLAAKSEAEFVALMNALQLPRPKLIDIAVPANLAGGVAPVHA